MVFQHLGIRILCHGRTPPTDIRMLLLVLLDPENTRFPVVTMVPPLALLATCCGSLYSIEVIDLLLNLVGRRGFILILAQFRA